MHNRVIADVDGLSEEKNWEALQRRQKMTTWGFVALAVFVSVGMAEWSKRTAASETVIDPAVMEEALKIAAAREGIRGLVVSHGGNGERESGKQISDLSGGLPNLESGKRKAKIGNEAATIQTSAGVEK